MPSPTLPVSRLIDVDVVMSPRAAQAQDLSTLLILGTSDVIDVVERIRTYTSIDQVAADFGTAAPEYLAAILWFGQSPQPDQLKIGRWAFGDTSGKLLCAPLSASASLISTWNAISNGGVHFTLNGNPVNLNGINFSAASNLNGVAALIQAAGAGFTCVYNSVYNRFEFTSNTTGPTSTFSFLEAAAGTDISVLLGGNDDQGGYVADGIDAQSALETATLFDSQYGQSWYSLFILNAGDDDHLAVAGYIEACDNKHLYGVATQNAGCLSPVSTTDIMYLLSQLNYNRTLVQYSSSSAYSIVSYLGRLSTVDYNGNATVITMMYKQEPGIVSENLTETQAQALEAKNGNVFAAYNNGTAIVQPGVQVSGTFSDDITNTDWLAVTIMTALYNLLYTSTTKVPQTDPGTHLLVSTAEAVCSQGAVNGALAAGVWTANGFGTLRTGDFLAKGFYVYAPPVALQSQADREARKSVPIQIAAKLAGAVHTVDVTINVNR